MPSSAIDEEGALLDFDYREVQAAQAIIANARHVILVADSTKFRRTAPVRIGHISQVQTFVTDRGLPAGLAKIVTRPLDERDHACGNEVIAYPPLSQGVSAQPAFTLGHTFKGQGLETSWEDPNCRSSFVGHFAR